MGNSCGMCGGTGGGQSCQYGMCDGQGGTLYENWRWILPHMICLSYTENCVKTRP